MKPEHQPVGDHFDRVYQSKDPWGYRTSEYESVKRQHTLELIAGLHLDYAVEYGCGEGVFTHYLAEEVNHLFAVDISQRALIRAIDNSKHLDNVSFLCHDISNGALGKFIDLALCSELLYYLEDYTAIVGFISSLALSIKIDGYLVVAHAVLVSDNKSQSGFDFQEIGADGIAQIISTHPAFCLETEIRTEFYLIQRYKRTPVKAPSLITGQFVATRGAIPAASSFRELSIPAPAGFKKGGCIYTLSEAMHLWESYKPPILMYHRVAEDGPSELAPYRISPTLFDEHLALLQSLGYVTISLNRYQFELSRHNPVILAGKVVILTFDDAYSDYYDNALPLLKRYGFESTVFVPTHFVGGYAEWDSCYGPPARIMDWDQIQEIHREGVEIGSHGARHLRLSSISSMQVQSELAESKHVLEEHIGAEITSFCYPFTAIPSDYRQQLSDAGYAIGVCGSESPSNDQIAQDPYALSRIEVIGSCSTEKLLEILPKCRQVDEASMLNYYELRLRRHRSLYLKLF